jgi:hypothetical protein
MCGGIQMALGRLERVPHLQPCRAEEEFTQGVGIRGFILFEIVKAMSRPAEHLVRAAG